MDAPDRNDDLWLSQPACPPRLSVLRSRAFWMQLYRLDDAWDSFPFSETYTFATTTDDGSRLWVDGKLIVDKWVNQGPTEWAGKIALKAGQKYAIKMEYYQRGGGASAKLLWSSPSTPKAIIPRMMLFPPNGKP